MASQYFAVGSYQSQSDFKSKEFTLDACEEVKLKTLLPARANGLHDHLIYIYFVDNISTLQK